MSLTSFKAQYPSLAGMPLVSVLQLIRTQNVGPITFFQLIQRYGTAEKALEVLPDLARRGGAKGKLVPANLDAVKKEIDAATRFGAQFIMYGEPAYPPLLMAADDPPPVITVLGFTHLWQQKTPIAMVGARNASANGCALAKKLAADLGAKDALIVSGLARGIDGFAHQGSLATGTVAVIAGGIDHIYPQEHAGLYAQLREQGAIISENIFGQAPFNTSFPARNRIIAGMTLGTVVVEASPKSGSLITARLALEMNREVMAVPGSPLDPRAKGCNHLLKQGATLIESADDVMAAIAPLRHLRLSESEAPPFKQHPRMPDESELSEARTLVLDKLNTTPITLDDLREHCPLPLPVLYTVLLELELAGRIKRLSGQRVALDMTNDS